MKRLFLILALLMVGCGAEAQVRHQWVEENDLFLEDGLYFYSSGMTETVFNQIINIAEQLYAPVAQNWGERLRVVRLWQDGTVNAMAYRDGRGYAEVTLYGGLARRPELRPLSFALVICHEFSHLYSGAPYLDTRLRVSAESQSDWAGAGWCLRNITEKFPDNVAIEVTAYMQKVCNSNSVCLRRLDAGNGLGALLARLNGDPVPRYETPDPTVVYQTNLSYASTQCRTDCYRAGILWQERPRCWYRP